MLILSIDTSCDESCAAVFDTDRWRLLSDVVESHVPAMTEYGGIVPELASREHLTALPRVVTTALEKAGIAASDIGHIAITNRPGLIGALLVGLNYGKALAWASGIPFSVEDHIEGHLYSPLLSEVEDGGAAVPPFPWIGLVVSGGHTELFYIPEMFDHRWLGGTLDDAAGEAFDKIGKILGLGYPAGPVIDRIAHEQSTNGFAFPVARVSDFNFSYSGVKTAVNLLVQQTQQKKQDLSSIKPQVAAAAQEAILAPLVREVRRATHQFPGARPVITGGVACNSRLRALLPEAYFPHPRHCTDNAAMIALVAAWKHRKDLLSHAPWSASAFARADWPGWTTVDLATKLQADKIGASV